MDPSVISEDWKEKPVALLNLKAAVLSIRMFPMRDVFPTQKIGPREQRISMGSWVW